MRNEFGHELTRDQASRHLYYGCSLLWFKQFGIAPGRWDRVHYLEDSDDPDHIIVVTTASEKVRVNLCDVIMPPAPRL